jgi:hypothetical protein
MPTVSEQLQEIDANPLLSAASKRADKYTLKCTSIANAVAPYVGNTYRYQGVDYTIHMCRADVIDGTPVLRIVVSGIRVSDGSTVLSAADEHRIVNPPILTSDKRESLIEAAQQMLSGMI